MTNEPSELPDRLEETAIVIEGLLDVSPAGSDRMNHRTLISGDNFRVILLSFPSGYVMKEHRTPKHLMLQALDGHFRLGFSGQDHDLRPGKLIRLDPGLLHEVEAYEEGRLMLTLIDQIVD